MAEDRSLDEHPYLVARGMRDWTSAVTHARQGELSASLDSLEKALNSLRVARETERVAAILSLRADILDRMMAVDEGWTERLAALDLLSVPGDIRKAMIWRQVARAAIRDHWSYAAERIFAEIADDLPRRRSESLGAGGRVVHAAMDEWTSEPVLDNALNELKRSLVVDGDPRTVEDLRDVHPVHSWLPRQPVQRSAAVSRFVNGRLVGAVGGLEAEARNIPDTMKRADFVEGAQALLTAASQVEIAHGRNLEALWLSNRARQVVLRTFAPSPPERDKLRPGDLLQYAPAGVTVVYQDLQPDQLLTWVIRDGHLQFVATRVAAEDLFEQVAQFREDVASRNDTTAMTRAHALYAMLLQPVAGLIAGDGLLVYAPPPALRGFPIAALYDGSQFLTQKREVAVVHSIGGYIARPQPRAVRDNAFVVLPAPAPGSAILLGATAESETISELYGACATSLRNAQATRRAFLAQASEYDVIHIGTHGHSSRQFLQSDIEFGEAKLRVYDVLSLRLIRSPVVVLASCRTDDESGGGTTAVGMALAFVSAGARAVVGSLWNVDDESTSRFMIDFHRRLHSGSSPAEALRGTQCSAIADHESLSSWAVFQLEM